MSELDNVAVELPAAPPMDAPPCGAANEATNPVARAVRAAAGAGTPGAAIDPSRDPANDPRIDAAARERRVVGFARYHPDFLGETARRIGLGHYADVSQLVVQHLYPDTLRLLLLLHRHVPIARVISIGYSGAPEVIAALRARGIEVLTPSWAELERTVDDSLGELLERAERRGQRLMIHEVGGYAIRALHERHAARAALVVGAVEVTKQGVWAAESLPAIVVPQLNVAQTPLKEVEGGEVGEAVVAALDTILRECGVSMAGREALVTGFGWVGSGTAHSLRRRGARVSVADTDALKLVAASVAGFGLRRGEGVASARPAIVIGASGRRSIDEALIATLPDRCFVASGASKDHEIDVACLERLAVGPPEAVHEHVDAWTLADGRTLFLVNRGYPVNFTSASVPDEIVEFLFAGLIMCVQELLEGKPAAGIRSLSPERERIAAEVWLDLR